MYKRIVLVTALLIAACGTGTSSSDSPGSDGSNPLGGGGGGAIPPAALRADTANVKFVLNTTRLVNVPATEYNASTDSYDLVTCTVGGNQCDNYPGFTCTNLVCSKPTDIDSIFYVKNVTRNTVTGALSEPLNVPCDGGRYSAEVYGADALGIGVRAINEAHKSNPFTMSTGCVATPATSIWPDPSAVVFPALGAFPDVYAGTYPPPYDKFSVTVTGLAYPWSRSWSLTYAGQVAPTAYASATATFLNPPLAPSGTTPTALLFTAEFRLHSSILLEADTGTPWVFQRRNIVGPIPFQSSGLTPP